VYISLGNINVEVERKAAFKSTVDKESLRETDNDNVVIFATSKHLVVKTTMFPYHSINICAWNCLDGKTHNHTDHVLVDKRRMPDL
jgi:hypothetical protein